MIHACITLHRSHIPKFLLSFLALPSTPVSLTHCFQLSSSLFLFLFYPAPCTVNPLLSLLSCSSLFPFYSFWTCLNVSLLPNMTTPHSTHEEEFAAARQNVAADKQNFRPVATVRQYNSKQKAFIAFCETKAYRDGSTVTENKLLVWLEEIWRKGNKRQQIKKTHRGKQRKRQVQGIGSNGTNAEESPDSPGTLANGAVNSGVDSSESSTGNTINLVGVWKPYSKEGLEGYCRPIVDLWRKQQNLGMNTHPTPRGSDVQAFLKNKEQETLRHSRSEFADRGIHTLLDGYHDKMPDICDWYFNQKTGNHLRNRLDFLCGHALITTHQGQKQSKASTS